MITDSEIEADCAGMPSLDAEAYDIIGKSECFHAEVNESSASAAAFMSQRGLVDLLWERDVAPGKMRYFFVTRFVRIPGPADINPNGHDSSY